MGIMQLANLVEIGSLNECVELDEKQRKIRSKCQVPKSEYEGAKNKVLMWRVNWSEWFCRGTKVSKGIRVFANKSE